MLARQTEQNIDYVNSLHFFKIRVIQVPNFLIHMYLLTIMNMTQTPFSQW